MSSVGPEVIRAKSAAIELAALDTSVKDAALKAMAEDLAEERQKSLSEAALVEYRGLFS